MGGVGNEGGFVVRGEEALGVEEMTVGVEEVWPGGEEVVEDAGWVGVEDRLWGNVLLRKFFAQAFFLVGVGSFSFKGGGCWILVGLLK